MSELLRHAHNLVRFTVTTGASGVAGKSWRALRRGGLAELTRLVRYVWNLPDARPVEGEPGMDRNNYAEWVRRFDTLAPDDLEAMRRDIEGWAQPPLISVIMPTYNTRPEWLAEVVASVQRQVYPRWELCIADDASPQPHVREFLERVAAEDTRIRVSFRTSNGHICASSNSALELATGEWIALLDHDDVLPAHALYWIAKVAVTRPDARMIYSDEDKLDDRGERAGAYFKPDWDPDLFRAQNMFSHLGAFHAGLVRQVGGFRPGFEGSQDYDLTLRCMEQVAPAQIVHVPRVLYHWRVHTESTAHSNDAKPYAQVAAERALNEHHARVGVQAHTRSNSFGYQTTYAIPTPAPRVGIVLTGSATPQRVQRVLQALRATAYADLRVCLPGGVTAPDAGPDSPFLTVRPTRLENAFAAAVRTLREQDCRVLCLLDAGAVPLAPDWLTEMVAQCLRPEVGVVGARLVDEDGRILSAGVARMDGSPRPLVDLHAGYRATSHGYGGRAQLVQRCGMVRSQCMVLRLDVFGTLGKSRDAPHQDGGVDFCRRLVSRGLAVVWTPHAEIELAAPLPPLPVPSVLVKAQPRTDAAYNPNLHRGDGDFSLAWPPLVTPVGARRLETSS